MTFYTASERIRVKIKLPLNACKSLNNEGRAINNIHPISRHILLIRPGLPQQFIVMLLSTFAITLLTATASIVSAQDGDWASNWDTSRTLFSAFDVDPEDSRSMMRGSGDVEIGGGIAKFFGSPRLYISHDDPSIEGWENVEITYQRVTPV